MKEARIHWKVVTFAVHKRSIVHLTAPVHFSVESSG